MKSRLSSGGVKPQFPEGLILTPRSTPAKWASLIAEWQKVVVDQIFPHFTQQSLSDWILPWRHYNMNGDTTAGLRRELDKLEQQLDATSDKRGIKRSLAQSQGLYSYCRQSAKSDTLAGSVVFTEDDRHKRTKADISYWPAGEFTVYGLIKENGRYLKIRLEYPEGSDEECHYGTIATITHCHVLELEELLTKEDPLMVLNQLVRTVVNCYERTEERLETLEEMMRARDILHGHLVARFGQFVL